MYRANYWEIHHNSDIFVNTQKKHFVHVRAKSEIQKVGHYAGNNALPFGRSHL